ncbi:unnamed protein product [Lactuca saligna]|uniref:Uncharacterized protein n=1 Tax=Lactuca saligna TaxID=75948 RepID=A0AA35VE00_LACSI|nr:unnamed protein product [Lactuca saligna]
MNILDEADVHQLRNVISETKEIVHLYLEVFQGLLEQTEAVEKVVPYNVENVVSYNVEECPEEETMAVNTVEEKKLYEFGRLTNKTLSAGEESNEEWSEDEFTQEKSFRHILRWRLYAKRLDPIDEFEIRIFNNVHTCSSLQIHPNHKHANKKVMGNILHEIMGKTRSKVWRPNEISRDLNALLEINVDYKQAWHAKQYAMELLLGSSE